MTTDFWIIVTSRRKRWITNPNKLYSSFFLKKCLQNYKVHCKLLTGLLLDILNPQCNERILIYYSIVIGSLKVNIPRVVLGSTYGNLWNGPIVCFQWFNAVIKRQFWECIYKIKIFWKGYQVKHFVLLVYFCPRWHHW